VTHLSFESIDVLLQQMRSEVTRLGVQELRTPAEVDAVLGGEPDTALVFVNSTCGCAAGHARPALAMALGHPVKPKVLTTVFAGQDREATARAREIFGDVPPSSPSVALLKGGKLAYLMPRSQIEVSTAEEIAQRLKAAFDEHCA
jgi:putative YphP/YqiW family bacilliredoxin